MAKSKRIESTIWFKYVFPERPYYEHLWGKVLKAQLTMLSVESNSARVRLYHEDGTLFTANYDISATQFFEQMQIVPK